MPDGLRIRRGRRTDFTAVMNLLATSGVAVPPPDRATLRRFRNLVADLGTDFYLASVDDTLAGLVHVTYARQLATGPRAHLAQLLVADAFRGRGIGSALLSCAQRRARQRGCATLTCGVAVSGIGRFLKHAGLQPAGEWYVQQLAVDA